jgi:hypothetical protein
VQKCTPKSVDYSSDSPCGSLFVQATAEDARRAGVVMAFSAGSGGGAGPYVSYETGVVYGDKGEFGCFATACAGLQSNVSIGNFANIGLYSGFSNFKGFAAISTQAVDTPLVQLGFQTSQVYSASAPSVAGEILKDRLIGTSSGLSFGVGLSPVTVGTALCYTAMLDSGEPLSGFRDVESLLDGWARLGFATNAMPASLGSTGSSPARPVLPSPANVRLMGGAEAGGCYWMTPQGSWQGAPQYGTKRQCYEQDSCNGGLGASGGGCYKWAVSPSASAERWED